ncbi:ATP-binding SpoIIE family protein phosphatase [Paenibacillus nasutitermitis]|uniref:HAMP domain-containing protein n=1 Tax=Paenibacillus nasutitermitis TaxID=1652958 RepID=A0A916ZFB7_9BACL|nr:SpoIIE family protein phosphatase [Paenibacillus nasutitermitis]GGD91871.1 hypothetical protein GCM10010911_58220 [Paenibacillus nasutitermitis]
MEIKHITDSPLSACSARTLIKRLLLVYLLSLLTGMIVLHAENIFIFNRSFHDLMPLKAPLTLLAILAGTLVLAGISNWRLGPVFLALGGDHSEQATRSALERLFRLPYELLIGLKISGLIVLVMYHGILLIRTGIIHGMQQFDWLSLFGALAGEMSLVITVAILIFTSVRWLLRPIILQLQPWPGSFIGRASIAHPLLFTFASTFLVALLHLFRLAVIAGASHDPDYTIKFGQIALFYFVMGLALFYYVTLQFRRELRGLVRSIRGLVGGRRQLSGKMPVISHDEAGELAVAFNELQSRIDREYESLERELKLAYNVQQKLLPPGDLTIGSYRIVARCQPYREVGGDFFDVVSLSPGRFAVMIGDVSGKGMPAALLMSALLLLFRAEIRRNGSPGQVLQRMNRQICEAMGNEGSVSIGVGVIDLTADTVQYASAGHLSPYIVMADGGFRGVDCSSLPIGFDAEAVYEEVSLQLHPGDRFVLYTDGLIEAVDEEGKMYSFEGLESELSTWQAREDIVQRVDSWLVRMDQRSGAGSDDRTVVILELAGPYRSALSQLDAVASERGDAAQFIQNQFMSREWSIPSRLGEERAVALELGEWIEESWPESNIREDVQSAMAEAMINAIEHGNKLHPSTYVTVLAQIGSRLAVFKIYDEGGGYFPRASKAEEEMTKKRESDDPRGWGLVIIDSLADYWATGRDDRGFYTELYFLRKIKPS